MSVKDLRIEIRDCSLATSKLRLSVRTQKEKNSAKYIREKKYYAQLKTILCEKEREELQLKTTESKLKRPKKSEVTTEDDKKKPSTRKKS
ncbi:hypothetical protein HN512_04550 [Candidatus Peregrinibacteria bacterium]|nr:hypothetical protein [Candidatus Peregrinibacteria bacterium]MBT4585626.1 hypothetical protein [Candidatus Peregrinibacteria bacterium]MBT7009346.1 hypothetical protein [Candidatus Peregrinibacteria bacterium]